MQLPRDACSLAESLPKADVELLFELAQAIESGNLAREQLLSLHGTVRGMRDVAAGGES